MPSEIVKKELIQRLDSDIFVSEAKIREATDKIETNSIGIKNLQSQITFERERIVCLKNMKKVLD